jgi:5-methylcytosine-specific restriction endonuclease McrA
MNFPDIDYQPKIRRRMDAWRKWEIMPALVARDGTNCHWCGCATFNYKRPPSDGSQLPDHRTLDHLIARCFGGADTLENAVVACFACNQRRGQADQFTVEWQRLAARAPNRLFGCFVIDGCAT